MCGYCHDRAVTVISKYIIARPDRQLLTVDWVDGIPIPTKGVGEPLELPAAEPLRLELQHFLDCVATGMAPRTDGREGLAVLSVLERATSSILEGSVQR